MKIIAIIGSPRKGDTYSAVQRFGQCLQAHGKVDIEYLMLSQVRLPDCVGCHNCFTHGRERCPQAVLVRELQDKLTRVDAVILASPVYNQGLTSVLKRFLDYFTFQWHRPEFFGVKFFGISSGGGMFGGVFKALRDNVQAWGGTWLGSLGVPHYEALTPKYRRKADADMEKAAVRFLKGVARTKLPQPDFGALMRFRVWRMNARACRDSIPADFDHWTQAGWFDRAYYYPTKINPVLRLCADAAAKLAQRFMRSIYVGY